MSNIVKFPDRILRTQTEKWDFQNPPEDAHKLVEQLLTVMNSHKGIGLSAVQIGKPYRVFVMRGDPNFACFNPKILDASEDTTNMDEGCLSLPGVVAKIKRSNKIRVRFFTASGGAETRYFEGLSAKVFQHELDHLDGKVFIDKLDRYHRDKAMKGYYNGRG